MHQLYLVEAGSVQDAREMLDSVLGKAVADKENPEISFSVQVGIGLFLAGLNQVSYVVESPAGTGGVRCAEVCDLPLFRIKIVFVVTVVVLAHLSAGYTAFPGRDGIDIAEEHAAKLAVGDDFAIILAIGEWTGVARQ